MVLKIPEDELGGAFFEPSNDCRGVAQLRRPDQKMEMFRHEDVTDDAELEFPSQGPQGGDKTSTKTLGIKQTCAAVRAGSDKVQMVESVIMPLARHGEIVAQGFADMAQNTMSAPPAGLHLATERR